jgi:hypothetical protein
VLKLKFGAQATELPEDGVAERRYLFEVLQRAAWAAVPPSVHVQVEVEVWPWKTRRGSHATELQRAAPASTRTLSLHCKRGRRCRQLCGLRVYLWMLKGGVCSEGGGVIVACSVDYDSPGAAHRTWLHV